MAVIDTGIDVDHPDLKNSIWKNLGESGESKESNGIDDDNNGYIDDVYGWNFADGDSRITDLNGHGTHIAGIIAKDPSISIMTLKYMGQDGQKQNPLDAGIEAIKYAVKMGARIINFSSGGYQPDEQELSILRVAQKAGVLVVAAAGNHGKNTDELRYFPADYPLDNILSVAAGDSRSRLLSFSNYGAQSVDLIAPGKNILSTLPGGTHGYMSGTSQATAFVTRKAARQMASSSFNAAPTKVIESLTEPDNVKPQLVGKVRFPVAFTAHISQGWQPKTFETASREIDSVPDLKKSPVNG